jgi:hypothetical protein
LIEIIGQAQAIVFLPGCRIEIGEEALARRYRHQIAPKRGGQIGSLFPNPVLFPEPPFDRDLPACLHGRQIIRYEN